MADEDDLSPEQIEKIAHYQDLTGIEDTDICRERLERHNWDIEIAVQDTFNEQEGNPSVYNPPPPDPPTPPVNVEPEFQRIYTAQTRAVQPVGLMQWSYYIITFPFRFMYTTILDVIRFAFQFLRPDPRRNVTDPVGDVTRFIATYNDRFGPNHPVFYQGSYSQALNDAKKELRFLLVYLHGIDHQDTEHFCRNTLGNTEVIQFINVNMLFWACDINRPEGYRVSQAMRENGYPFLALIVLRDNRMTVVARITGPIEPNDLIQRLQTSMNENEASLVAARADSVFLSYFLQGRQNQVLFGNDLIQRLQTSMNENEASLVAARADRAERSFNQSLRQQQDEAYHESLRADQEKERKKREEREKEMEEENRLKQIQEDHKRMLQERELRKDELRLEIPDEPNQSDDDVINVVLKLPDGTRIGRRFLRSQSLKYLYYFTFCHEACPDDFNIVTNFPRKTLPCEPMDGEPDPMSFGEYGLGKNELLFVQDNEA